MPDPIRIPLSTYQQARFAAHRADAKAVQDRQNEAVTSIIAGVTDPAAIGDWTIALNATEIVLTPPAESA